MAGGARLDADTVVSEGSWSAATAGTGAVLDGLDLAFGDGPLRSFCAVRPPGHHALRNSGMGFCLFGNVAVGAHYARSRHGVERVLIVDWDVHHGNGTQALVQDTPEIHFVSLHQWPWYPGTGAAKDRGPHGNVWNVPMSPGLPREKYVDAFLSAVDSATEGFTPDVVLVSAGFDSLAGDPLGGFTLEMDDVARLTGRWCRGRSSGAGGGSSARSRVAMRRSGSARRAFGTCGRWRADERAAKVRALRRFGTRGRGRSSCKGGTTRAAGHEAGASGRARRTGAVRRDLQ